MLYLARNKVLARRRLRNVGRWSLDRYYRRNIVNNVPLGQSCVYICARATGSTPPGMAKPGEPPCSSLLYLRVHPRANPSRRTGAPCLLLNIHSLPWYSREHGVYPQINRRRSADQPLTTDPFAAFIGKDRRHRVISSPLHF